MIRMILLIGAVASLLLVSGCQSPSGSREFVPGKGWSARDAGAMLVARRNNGSAQAVHILSIGSLRVDRYS
jgi:hypothetical protein